MILGGETLENKIKCLKKLNQTHYQIHCHGNNCSGYKIINNNKIPDVIEMTFVRKGYFIAQNIAVKNNNSRLPSILDVQNKKTKPDYDLNFKPFVF